VRKGLLIGLTGGIGCGKSTVGRMFSENGRLVLSADNIANDLTSRDPEVRSNLSRVFGANTFLSDGSLSRKKLADKVFRDAALLKKLNAIIHPKVIDCIRKQVRSLPHESSFPFVVVEAPLIYEARMEAIFDYIIVVDAPLEERIARVMARDNVPKSEVLRRIRSQVPAAEKKRKADFVISNRQGKPELLERVSFVDRILVIAVLMKKKP